MPWKDNSGSGSGGPWGGSGSGGNNNKDPGKGRGPWGGRGNGGGPRGPGGPNFEDMLRRGQENVKKFMPGRFGSPRGIVIIALVAVVGWLLTGIYQVNPRETGVELIFGKYSRTVADGWHWNWPAPIGSVSKPNTGIEQRVEVGFTSFARGRAGESQGVTRESLMLTGDENIIDIHAVVFWRIDVRTNEVTIDGKKQEVQTGIRNYLFNIRAPDRTVKDAAESALREIAGRNKFDAIRTTDRARIETEAQKLIQDILNSYGTGIEITRVQLQKIDPPAKVLESFRDVQAAAADRVRLVNDADGYYNKEVEQAKGQASRILAEAAAYRQERIVLAQGEASRFLAIYREYAQAKDVTRQRIYLDAMRDILRNMDKVLLDGRSGGAVPYLPLEPLRRPPGAAANPPPR